MLKTKERTCLKFTGYIFLPRKREHLKYAATHMGSGRLWIFDKYNNAPKKGIACNIGSMVHLVTNAYQKRSMENLKGIK